MELKNVLSGIEGLKAKGDLSLDIKHITRDSRDAKEDSLFVAIKGFEQDGHSFIKEAVENRSKGNYD